MKFYIRVVRFNELNSNIQEAFRIFKMPQLFKQHDQAQQHDRIFLNMFVIYLVS